MNIRSAVVITGASTGIGRACALYLDRLGFQVFAGVRRQEDGQSLQQHASTRLTPVFIDVTKPETVAVALHTVAAGAGRHGLAGLVNNAGIAVGGPVEFVPIAELRRQFEINVIGQVLVTQNFLSLLRRGRGRIINMSSISGRVAMPFMGPYAASKFALEALTDSLRLELHRWGIEVISIQPGAVATPIWQKSLTKAQTMLNNLPREAHPLYGDQLAALMQTTQEIGEQGIPAEEVAKVVARALTAKRPKSRYLVGRDAKMGALLASLLPGRWRDWFIIRKSKKNLEPDLNAGD